MLLLSEANNIGLTNKSKERKQLKRYLKRMQQNTSCCLPIGFKRTEIKFAREREASMANTFFQRNQNRANRGLRNLLKDTYIRSIKINT